MTAVVWSNYSGCLTESRVLGLSGGLGGVVVLNVAGAQWAPYWGRASSGWCCDYEWLKTQYNLLMLDVVCSWGVWFFFKNIRVNG